MGIASDAVTFLDTTIPSPPALLDCTAPRPWLIDRTALPMIKVHSSRRAAGLKPTDYDHEIALVDHDGLPVRTERDQGGSISTQSRLLPSAGDESKPTSRPSSEPGDSETRLQERPARELEGEEELPHPALRPSIEVQGTHDSIPHLELFSADRMCSPDSGNFPRCTSGCTEETARRTRNRNRHSIRERERRLPLRSTAVLFCRPWRPRPARME